MNENAGSASISLIRTNGSVGQVSVLFYTMNGTAQSGPGNLLGNLLCSVANLLNGPSLLGQQITGILNIVQQLLGTPSLLTL